MSDDAGVGAFMFIGIIAISIWSYGCVEEWRDSRCYEQTKNEKCYERLTKKLVEPKTSGEKSE